ncbi:MAG: PEP-CTERM sorting domain-containing protein [Gammaproteobacteria bacterium]|nr:PEP-CTERM sorting domain-containing protein [Gammaproteobacteria bacterium]MBU1603309.1 PEP-CTERM sorting domain-containing protein [Gammaproteobacteria bacterium]MBU2432829.1 PEP-CTERM sorting domain-containing protein [Gammaproteobacteria bacterium]MBU2450072.1 PEP-CTERM sorting domain-containing protein [Gammaproteobacteria bacterium]
MRHLSLLLSALLFSAFAQAATTANITTASCSGSQSFDLSNGALLSCDGDFSLIGGSIDSDISITIRSQGLLTLGDLMLSAPVVQLLSMTDEISLAGSWSITAGSVNIGNTNRLEISPAPSASQGSIPRIIVGTMPILSDIAQGQAHLITLRSGEGIFVRQGGDIDLRTGGQIVLNGGGGLALVSSVPEPAMVWSLLGGGLLLAIRRNRRKAQL